MAALLIPILLLALAASGCSQRQEVPSTTEPQAGGTPPPATGGEGQNATSALPQPGPGQAINPLTGLPVPQAALEQRMFLVAIGNNPSARPQSGLSHADLVYELPAEGGITRFLALYWAGEAEVIGPVRSSRHYFLDLALERQAVWVHAGGSPQHYAQIGKVDVPDLDDVRGAPGVFWRSEDRRRPDNLYTSSERVRSVIRDKGWERSPVIGRPWQFALPDQIDGEPATSVSIDWPGGETVVFDYGAEGLYDQRRGGELVTDQATGAPVRAANLIVQYVQARRIAGDAEGRLD
ncbi:MAG TPA: DUF3048 domain-containing protein, partial [Bacillota bacterium]